MQILMELEKFSICIVITARSEDLVVPFARSTKRIVTAKIALKGRRDFPRFGSGDFSSWKRRWGVLDRELEFFWRELEVFEREFEVF